MVRGSPSASRRSRTSRAGSSLAAGHGLWDRREKGERVHQVKLRSPIGVFFLALITGGIYYFYWFYRVNEEAAIISRDEEANPGLSLLAATLGILLIVPFFWTHWTTANRVLPV